MSDEIYHYFINKYLARVSKALIITDAQSLQSTHRTEKQNFSPVCEENVRGVMVLKGMLFFFSWMSNYANGKEGIFIKSQMSPLEERAVGNYHFQSTSFQCDVFVWKTLGSVWRGAQREIKVCAGDQSSIDGMCSARDKLFGKVVGTEIAIKLFFGWYRMLIISLILIVLTY